MVDENFNNKIKLKSLFTSGVKNIFKTTEFTILAAVFVIIIILYILTPNFLTSYNISTLVRQISFFTIVAFGQTLVLITGGIDLSVGAVAGICAMIASWLMVYTPIDAYICIIIGIAIGALIGTVNGLFIAKLKINAFIMTLAIGEICTGFIMVLTKGRTIVNIPEKAVFLGKGSLGPIPFPVIYMIILAIILAYMLRNTPFGRFIYAIGDNENAGRLVGIKINKVKIIVYIMASAMAAFAGIMFVCRLSTGQPTIGQEWLLPSATAAIIGGTSLSGGQGGVIGTLIGALLMGVLTNAIVLLNVSSYWQKVVIGFVVLLAVVVDNLKMMKRR